MTDQDFTYRIKRILLTVLAWEIIFWIVTSVFLVLLGYLENGSAERIGFRYENALWLLILLVPVLAVYFYNLHDTNRIALQTGSNLRHLVLTPVSSKKSFFRFFFFRNAFVLLILALAQPVFGTKKVSGTIESMEIVVCLDVSNSMNTKDLSKELSRLQIAKRAVIQMLNNLHGEKVGVCVFAGSAFVQLPLTTDYSAAKLFINEIETGIISNQGTNISAALSTTSGMFSEQKSSKAIILVTDGENHEEDPSKQLAEIREKKIGLSVLGIGSSSGGPVPINPDRPELGYKTNSIGMTVVSKVNAGLIRSLAAKGGGTAVISSSEFPDLGELLTEINQMKRTKLRDLQFDMKESRYQVPLFGALIFWAMYLFLLNGTTRKERK